MVGNGVDDTVEEVIISYGGIGKGFSVRFREDMHKLRGFDLPIFCNDQFNVYLYQYKANIPFEVHDFRGEGYVGGELHFFQYNGRNRFNLVNGTNRMSTWGIRQAFRNFGFHGDLKLIRTYSNSYMTITPEDAFLLNLRDSV